MIRSEKQEEQSRKLKEQHAFKKGQVKMVKDENGNEVSIQSLGGKAAQKKNIQNRTFKELFNLVLHHPVKKEVASTIKKKFPQFEIKDKEVNSKLYLALQLYKKASKGDIKAIDMILNIIGEQPSNSQSDVNFNFNGGGQNLAQINFNVTTVKPQSLENGGNKAD